MNSLKIFDRSLGKHCLIVIDRFKRNQLESEKNHLLNHFLIDQLNGLKAVEIILSF